MSNYQSQHSQRRRNRPPPRNNRYQNQSQSQSQSQTIRPTVRNSPPSSVNAHASNQAQIDSKSTPSNPCPDPSSPVPAPAAPQQDIRNLKEADVEKQNTCWQCRETGHFSKDCPLNQPKECYNCNESGHYARDCPWKEKQDFSHRDKNVQCYNCGEYGHYSSHCGINYNERQQRGNKNVSTRSRASTSTDREDIKAIFTNDKHNVINVGKIGWIQDDLVLIKHLHKENGKCTAVTVRKLGKNVNYDKIEDIDNFSFTPPQTVNTTKVLKALWGECRNRNDYNEFMDGSIVKIKGKGFGTINKKRMDGIYMIQLTKGGEIEALGKELKLSSVFQERLNEIENPYEVQNDGEMDVYDFLEEVADIYMWRFVENGITSLKYLLTLNAIDLKEVGMKLGHRKYFAKKIEEFDASKWSIEKKEKQEERERLEKERMEHKEEKRIKKLKRRKKEILEDVEEEKNDVDDTERKKIEVPGSPQSISSGDIETGYEDDIEESNTEAVKERDSEDVVETVDVD